MIPALTWWIALAAFSAVIIYGMWQSVSARQEKTSRRKARAGGADGGGYSDPGLGPYVDGGSGRHHRQNDAPADTSHGGSSSHYGGGDGAGGGDGGGGGGD